MRQPHVIKSCSDISAPKMRNEPVARIKPIGAPNCGNMPYQARLPSGAFSVANSTAPDHSPPKPKPCPKRHNANSNGAIIPICAYVGSKPIQTVEIPMVNNAATKVALRPIRSPKCPNNAAPIGRAIKAIAKVASD